MCLTSGFRIWTLYQILASVSNYNNVFTNAKISYVAQKGKYVSPNIGPTSTTLESCLNNTVYPNIVACYVMFSPSKQECSSYFTSKCDDYEMSLLENKVEGDTTVYMRVTHTSSSTADPTSKSLSPTVSNSVSTSVATVTSSVASSTATISPTAASTFMTQPTLMHSTPSDPTFSSTPVYAVESNPTVDYSTPTPSDEVSDSIFISTPVSTYQEMITSSLETFDSTQPLTTEQISDFPEVIPSFSISASTTPSLSNTTSEEISSNITTGSPGFNNSVSTSSESSDKKLCPCKCRQSPLTEEELENTIVSLRKELSVNKSTLSRTIRSKTSAPDNRTSATSMGMAGIVILVSCVVVLVASDFSHLCQHAKILKRNLMSRFK